MSLTKIIHGLAGVKKETRDTALESLQQHLTQHGHEMSPLDYEKCWQGLLYCFWLTDKEYVQHQVARYMARLIHVIPHTKRQTAAFRFMRTFFSSIVEYWSKVDMHRVAKYLSLIRYVLHESFVFLRDTCRYEYINRFNAIMKDGPLKVHSGRHIASLAVMTHMIDIFVQEAEKVFARNESSKMYAMDEEIDYDNADIKINGASKSKTKDVEVISSKDFLKLLDPFFEAYATTAIDSVIVAFDKTMWRQLEEYKDPDMDMVEAVKRERLGGKNKKAAFVVGELHHLQEYARPAKGSLSLDLDSLSEKFSTYGKLKTTKNKTKCINWHNAFASATHALQIKQSNDPLAIFKKELSDVAQRNANGKKHIEEEEDEDDDDEEYVEEGEEMDEEDKEEESSEDEENDDSDDSDMDDKATAVDTKSQTKLLKIAKALVEKQSHKATTKKSKNSTKKSNKSKKRVSFELGRNEVKSYDPTPEIPRRKERKLKNAIMKPKKVKNKMKAKQKRNSRK